MSMVKKHKLPKSYCKRLIKTIASELDDLEIDYNDYDNDEVPNDFICFNVPITQTMNELKDNIVGESRDIELEYLSASNSSSPCMSDDSFLFPNLENNYNAFNNMDQDVQNLTLEFNLKVDFLKSEQLTQQKINKKKITQINKKITKSEKFWIKFLNLVYLGLEDHQGVLNKQFSNAFNSSLSNYLSKFEIYQSVENSRKNVNPVASLIAPSRRSISPRNSSSVKNSPLASPRNSNIIRKSSDAEYQPNVIDMEMYEVNSKQYMTTFGLSDLRYKKKYALPNNNSVENLDFSVSQKNQGGSKLYSIVNATNNSCLSIDSTNSANSTFSLSPEHNEISTFALTSTTNSPTYNFYMQQNDTPRSSVLSVNSISSYFKKPAAAAPKAASDGTEPGWWQLGLSTSPLPPLLLKFCLTNNLINEDINSMSLRSIIWYLSQSNFVSMNKITFDALNADVKKFVKSFDYYMQLIGEIESHNHEDIKHMVKKLKSFLRNFDDKQKFQQQLAIFKKINTDIGSLKLNSQLKKSLRVILLNFYFYLFDIGAENVVYNKEIIAVAHILVRNIKNEYLTFNCMINLIDKNNKLSSLRSLIFDEPSSISTVKTFIKMLKNQLPQLYLMFKLQLGFNCSDQFDHLLNYCLKKTFNLNGVVNDELHTQFIERFFDILFLDNNNNLLVYLATMFLSQHQKEILGATKITDLRWFIDGINNKTNELLFKNIDAQSFVSEIKQTMMADLNNELTVDDMIEYEQLAIEI